MENICGAVKEDDDQKMELPPGFRFHPSDEELITHYLSEKVVDNNFICVAMGEVDMNKVEPWDLPWKAKMGEKEWYFFCLRDKKYPTGLRTNRATAAGYWKATGKDKAIFRGKSLIGMKKTLVFYRGRAPRGEKSNWVIHEFRLEGKLSLHNLPKTTKNEWVICRVFQKSSGGKKIHISGLVRLNSAGNEMGNSFLPPLTDSSPYYSRTMPVASETSHVHCFSNSITAPTSSREDDNNCLNNYPFSALSNSMDIFSRNSLPSAFPWNQTLTAPVQSSFINPGSFPFQDPAILRTSLKNYGQSIKQEKEIVSVSQETGPSTDVNTEISSFEDQEAPPSTAGAQFLDCIWNY